MNDHLLMGDKCYLQEMIYQGLKCKGEMVYQGYVVEVVLFTCIYCTPFTPIYHVIKDRGVLEYYKMVSE